MKISDRRLRISDSLRISDFSNSLRCCSTPEHPQQYAYALREGLGAIYAVHSRLIGEHVVDFLVVLTEPFSL